MLPMTEWNKNSFITPFQSAILTKSSFEKHIFAFIQLAIRQNWHAPKNVNKGTEPNIT